VHVEALGSLSPGGPPVRPDSLFRIASITKPVTGAATLALVREGLLGLDEPVGRLLPELAAPRVLRRMDGPLGDTAPARRAITVRDLLTFTFGFGDTADMLAAPAPWQVVARASCTWPRSGRPARPSSRTRTPGSRAWDRCRCWPGRESAGSATPAPRSWGSCSSGRQASRSRTCSGPGCSSRWA
jgi:CubicO group peptidase (beta-lactamase class C family)